MSRGIYDPYWRPGWRRLARRKSLEATERAVRRVASSRTGVRSRLAWPFLLVTWRQPRILEAVLSRHEEQLRSDDCFSMGLGAAMVVWVESAPGETRITELLDHQPNPATPELAGAWEALVRKPCDHAITRTYPLLKKAHHLDGLFRYPITAC